MISSIYDLADKAARCTLRGHSAWTREDWEDATQEAVVAIWILRDQAEGYAFSAAKSAIYSWMRLWLRHPRGGTVLDYLDYSHETEQTRSRDYLAALYPMLNAQGSMKTHEDICYLELRLAGYSTAGIAMVMGISERNVYAIRERLIPRLERIALDELPLSRSEAVRQGKARARRQV